MNTIKIKKLHPDAIIPTRAHPTDSGLDLYALSAVCIPGRMTMLVPSGIAVDIPPGYEAQVRPRSGITLRTPLRVQLGTIDCGYTGDIGIIVDNIDDSQCYINKGDKIAQLVIQRVELPDINIVEAFDSESARGTKGYGSTGR